MGIATADLANAPEPRQRPKKVTLFDARSRELVSRFISEWVRPRWRSLLVALLLTASLALATGAYPMVIKFAFDNLMSGDVSWLPWVLVAILIITAARGVFLYLQTVTT